MAGHAVCDDLAVRKRRAVLSCHQADLPGVDNRGALHLHVEEISVHAKAARQDDLDLRADLPPVGDERFPVLERLVLGRLVRQQAPRRYRLTVAGRDDANLALRDGYHGIGAKTE